MAVVLPRCMMNATNIINYNNNNNNIKHRRHTQSSALFIVLNFGGSVVVNDKLLTANTKILKK